MGYVYLVYSSSQQSLALKARSQLEALRVSVWVRDPALDRRRPNERVMIESALASASVFLLVWHAATDQATPQARIILQDVSQAHERRLPILVLEHERDLPTIIQRVRDLLPNEAGVPLPIPYDVGDEQRIHTLVAELQRPQRRLIVASVIAVLGTIILIGLFAIIQNNLQALIEAPELPTLIATATDTPSATLTHTPPPTETPPPSPTPTETPPPSPTPTETPPPSPTPTETPPPSPTPTDIPPTETPRPSDTPTATLTPTATPTLTLTPTATPTPFMLFATNTPAS
ncbi:MAG: hypothetical protein SNJ54_13515 [Anaerolineae bacterium]